MTRSIIKLTTLFTRTRVHFLIAFVCVSVLTFYGYTHHEDFVDTEKLEIETPATTTIQEIPVVHSGTTTIPILVYHKISTPGLLPQSKKNKARDRFSVQNVVFESQMQFIENEGYTPLTIQELINDEMSGNLPLKPIAVTFDDGWRSQYNNALPVLTKYKIPATFYIYTGVIGSPAYMTWDDLHTLVDLKMEIGGHTKTHPRLTKINPSKLDEELVQSKQVLEKNLHVHVSDFAYPYGNYNDAIIKAVKEAGYTSARTSNKGTYNDFKDLYQLNVLYAPSDLKTLQNMLHKG
jgi:peptidoglycan/xylan/chitin deacetylase (PgdA/CDA1 family)